MRKNFGGSVMNSLTVFPIGKIENKERSVCVKLDPKYAESGNFDWAAEFNF